MSSVSRSVPFHLRAVEMTAQQFWDDSSAVELPKELPKQRTVAPNAVFQTSLHSMDCGGMLRFAMTRLKCASQEEFQRFLIYKILYESAPATFQITCGIHQNNPQDQLHFSVRVGAPSYKSSITLHFYGYIAGNGMFSLSHLTASHAGGDAFTVCNFVGTRKVFDGAAAAGGGGDDSSDVTA